MPIYEFKCEDCGHVFSELKKIGDFEGAVCPSCGSEKTAKKMSSFSSPGTVSAKGCSTSGGG
jgi:putative FmdB family regulatory protein